MTHEQKAKELVVLYKNILPRMNYVVLDEAAKQCAIIACDEILSELNQLKKPEYTTFIFWEQLKEKEEADTMDGYEKIDFWQQVKQHIQLL